MKFRSTLILLIVAAGAAAYIYFVEQHQQSTAEAGQTARQIVSVDRDDANALTIKNPEGKIQFAKGADGRWTIEEPLKDRAESMEIEGIFSALEGLSYDDAIGKKGAPPSKDQLKEFGLDSSETRLEVGGGKSPVEIVFGKDAAVEGKIYVKVAGRDPVYVIDDGLKTRISKGAGEFRDKKLIDLNVGSVVKAVFKTPAGEIEIQKKDEHWTLEKPLKSRADDARVGDSLSQATTLRADRFVKDADPAETGLEAPRGTVSLFTADSDTPTVLSIGAAAKDEKDKDRVYAKQSTREAVVLVPKAVESLLELKPNDLRARNVLQFENDIVDRITIEPAGKPKIVLARDKENWVLKGEKDQPVNGAAAMRILSELKAASVADFVSDVDTDLEKYGLAEPALKVTISSFASENTSETKAGEKPIETLLLGKQEGANVYAKLASEPFIVTIPATILDSLITDPLQLQELAIFDVKPEDVTGFEVVKEKQPPLSFERGEEKKWKLAKGDGKVNEINAQSLVNTLSSLRAVRWLGQTEPDHGLEKPALTVSFKAGDQPARKLNIGAKTPEDMWMAGVDGREGTFLMSRPDMDALELPLIEGAAADASKTPGATPAAGETPPVAKPAIEAVTPPVRAPMPPAATEPPLPAEPAPPAPAPAPEPATPALPEKPAPPPEKTEPAPELPAEREPAPLPEKPESVDPPAPAPAPAPEPEPKPADEAKPVEPPPLPPSPAEEKPAEAGPSPAPADAAPEIPEPAPEKTDGDQEQ